MYIKTDDRRQRERRRLSIILEKRLKRRKDSEKKRATSVYINPYPKVKVYGNRVDIIAPEKFSILDNTAEMLLFFDKLKELVADRKKIFLDIAEISVLTPEAILYMLSLFQNFGTKRHVYPIQGNLPKNELCKKMLLDSGFFKYVQPDVPYEARNVDILTIKQGEIVDTAVAKTVVDFCRDHLGKDIKSLTSSIYATLIECMANTRNHAYKDKGLPISPTWRLMAIYDQSAKTIKFIFLDNGVGIPSTIKKTFLEYLPLGYFVGKTGGDLILSALQGAFRTSTNQRFRGKGLPRIYNYYKNNQLANLKIVSKNSYVDCDTNSSVELSRRFSGTLFCWDFL